MQMKQLRKDALEFQVFDMKNVLQPLVTKPPVKNPETASFTYEPNEFEETCGEYLGTGFIIGGETTKQGEIPYIAALGYRNANGKIYYNCAGTLINRYIFI